MIDEEVRRLIDESHETGRTILLNRHTPLERIARELILKETLDRYALDELLHVTPATEKEVAFEPAGL